MWTLQNIWLSTIVHKYQYCSQDIDGVTHIYFWRSSAPLCGKLGGGSSPSSPPSTATESTYSLLHDLQLHLIITVYIHRHYILELYKLNNDVHLNHEVKIPDSLRTITCTLSIISNLSNAFISIVTNHLFILPRIIANSITPHTVTNL